MSGYHQKVGNEILGGVHWTFLGYDHVEYGQGQIKGSLVLQNHLETWLLKADFKLKPSDVKWTLRLTKEPAQDAQYKNLYGEIFIKLQKFVLWNGTYPVPGFLVPIRLVLSFIALSHSWVSIYAYNIMIYQFNVALLIPILIGFLFVSTGK